jgi:hypothetical protein
MASVTVTPHIPQKQSSIKINGYLQEGNLVFVQLPFGTYEIDGKEVIIGSNGVCTSVNGEKVAQNSRLNAKMFSIKNHYGVIIDLDCIEKIFKKSYYQSIKHYANADDINSVLSVEEYNKEYETLLSEADYDERSDEYIWPSISARLKFENFCQLWIKQTQENESFAQVVIDIVDNSKISDSEFIIPVRKVTGDFSNTLFNYLQYFHVKQLVMDKLIADGYVHLEGSAHCSTKLKCFATNDKLEYFKFSSGDGSAEKYVCIEIPTLKVFDRMHYSQVVSGTLEEMEQKAKVNKKIVDDAFAIYKAKSKSISEINIVSIREVLGDVETVIRLLNEVESMKRTSSSMNIAREKARNLQKNLFNAIVEMEKNNG